MKRQPFIFIHLLSLFFIMCYYIGAYLYLLICRDAVVSFSDVIAYMYIFSVIYLIVLNDVSI